MSKVLEFPARKQRSRKQHQYSLIVPFPPQHVCPTCNRVCSPEDLSECLTCGQQYCQRNDCDWTCACDRYAVEMYQRAEAILSQTP